MSSTLERAVAAAVAVTVLVVGSQAQKKAPEKAQEAKPAVLAAPVVGAIAPPLGAIPWIQLDEASDPARGGKEPDIDALRGTVTVVATYGYYCDSCVRVGVPTMN